MTPEQWLKAEKLLSPKELEELRKIGSIPDRRLSPVAQAHYFGLFLQNYSTFEISKQNKGLGEWGLGLIVRARIEYSWDEEKDKHIRSLMDSTRATVTKTTLESVQFASDGMAAYHKLAGDCFRKYLQTGNQDDLGEFRNMSFKTYKDLVRVFISLTDKKNQPSTDRPLDSVFPESQEEDAIMEQQEASDPASILAMLTNVKSTTNS